MAAGDTQITIAGNLVDDPELRFTPAGQPVAKFRVASTPRFRDNTTGEWKDGDSLFLTCNVWRQAAENVAETLTRGMRVIVSGGCGSGRTRRRKARSGPSTRLRWTRWPLSAERVGQGQPGLTERVGWPGRAGAAVWRPGKSGRRRCGPVGVRQPWQRHRRASLLGRAVPGAELVLEHFARGVTGSSARITRPAGEARGREKGRPAAVNPGLPGPLPRPPENGGRRALAERRRPSSIQAGIASGSAPASRHSRAADRASGSSSSPSDVPSRMPATSASKSARPAASARSSASAAAPSSAVSGRHCA